MGDFGDAERRILAFMAEGTEFVFQEKNYKINLARLSVIIVTRILFQNITSV